jgi:L-asparaginase type II
MISIQNNKIGKRLFILLLITLLLLSVTLSGAVGGITKAAADQLPTFPIPAVSDVDVSAMPNVLVIGTGGTISGQANDGDPTNLQSYKSGTYLIKDMVAQLPRKDKIADVNTYQFGNKGSGSYAIGDLYDLSLTVDQALKSYDSVVVTTGTDTMEEIAYFLDLTVKSEKPVVVTGSMRPWDVIGTDAPANLYNAIKLAGSGKTKSYGTVLMLNDIIQAAREVTKTNAQRLDTFMTPVLGALGYIDQDNISIYRMNDRVMKAGQPGWATPFDLSTINKADLPIVEVAYAYQDANGAAIKGFVEDGAKGIVTAGTGTGGISSKMSTARSEAIKQGVIFVTTTRTGSGTMYPGNTKGIIAGDNLNPQHARLMLLVAMAFSKDFTTIKSWFETYGSHTIDLDRQAPIWPADSTLTVKSSGQNSVSIQWPHLEGENAATYYRLYVNNGALPLTTLNGSENSFEVTGLNYNTTYNFKLKAVDQAGNESVGLVSLLDISGHWAEVAIKTALNGGIVSGYPDGTFKPEQSVTRAEFVVLLMNALKPQGDGVVHTFTDNGKISDWALTAVSQADKAGIISGYPDGTFRPDEIITRSEMTMMIASALKLNIEAKAVTGFADDTAIPAWAKGAVKAVKDNAIIQGRGGKIFAPKEASTRAEAMTIIVKLSSISKS